MTGTQKLTRQGVRDLNGPTMAGTGYNGRRGTTCPHFRDPHFPTHREEEIREVTMVVEGPHGDRAFNKLKKVSVYYCISCGQERWFE